MKFTVENRFKKKYYYPACYQSKRLCELLKRETLSEEIVNFLLDAGMIKLEEGNQVDSSEISRELKEILKRSERGMKR